MSTENPVSLCPGKQVQSLILTCRPNSFPGHSFDLDQTPHLSVCARCEPSKVD